MTRQFPLFHSLRRLFLLSSIAAIARPLVSSDPRAATPREWRMHGGDSGHTQYSELTQINTRNVHRLIPAWTYNTGDKRDDDRSQIQCNPIIVHSVLYATSPQLKVFALKADTGDVLWSFDPFAAMEEKASVGVNRGVVHWEDGDDRRILFTAGSRLFALDARSGRLIPGFGSNGSVDLHDGLGRDASGLNIRSNTPGAVYKDLLILGTLVSEGPGPSAPGHIRAYDVRTGKIRWIFHTIPHPGEFGYDTWPADAWKRSGGANVWSGISVDRERGLAFLPTGSGSFDFWGGNRAGDNLFANCVLALQAATGERVWHYQVVRHDVWDRDLPAAPVLVSVRHSGRKLDAVAQITKSGHVFLLDRSSGKPLFPIRESSVPPSDLEGEVVAPSQPLPVKPPPFARQQFNEEDATDISLTSRSAVLERLRKVRTGRPWIPPSREGTVIFPGFDGGGEWGGAAYDPSTSILYVNSNEMPWILTMVEVKKEGGASGGERVYRQHCAACHGVDLKGDPQRTYPSLEGLPARIPKSESQGAIRKGKGTMPAFAFLSQSETDSLLGFLYGESQGSPGPSRRRDVEEGIPYTHTGYNRFLDPEGYPAVKPPWGTLSAIDLNKGALLWQIPLGETEELRKRGIKQPTGTENYGGPIVTAGGLIFIGATKDEKFRAFDKKTGKVLWQTTLPAGGYATPSSYEVNGKQYVVIAAGGGKMGTKSGDAYVCFTLPN